MPARFALAAAVMTAILSPTPEASAQAPMAFATELVCGGRAARFGVVDNVPTLERSGRRYAFVHSSREGRQTTHRTADRRVAFIAQGRSGTLVLANGRRIACKPTGAARETMSAPAGATDTLEGGWRVRSVNGATVPQGITITMEFGAEKRVSGRGGCNRYTGSFEHAGGRLSFGALATTRMACPPRQMEAERQFLAAARDVTHVALSDARELVLSGGGRPVIVLARTH